MWRCVSFDITRIYCPCIGSCAHVRVAWQNIVIRWLWRARAEQEGEEEEGHYTTTSPSIGHLLYQALPLEVDDLIPTVARPFAANPATNVGANPEFPSDK